MDVIVDGFEDGSTWPSSRDCDDGAAKAEAAPGVVAVVLMCVRV